MARVIDVPDPSVIHAVMSPNASAGMMDMVQNQMNQFMNAVGGAKDSFFEGVKSTYDAFMNNDIIKKAVREARNKVSNLAGLNNVIVALNDITSIRRASPLMQNYIMACPEIRREYYDNMIDGYSETYVDPDPNIIGDYQYEYMQVMDGILDMEGKTDHWAVNYIFDLREGDQYLEFNEQVDVLRTWDVAIAALAAGEDPTDPTLVGEEDF